MGESNESLPIPPPIFDSRRRNPNRRSNNVDGVPVRKQRRSAMAKPSTTSRARATDAALERRLDRLGLTGKEDDWTDRYLLCEHLVDPATALPRQRFEAVARLIRDLVAHRWVKTRQARENANPKRVYYLSMEFLIGRTLNNNMMNLAAEPLVQRAMKKVGLDFPQLQEEEPDADLGKGGCGRLAACF